MQSTIRSRITDCICEHCFTVYRDESEYISHIQICEFFNRNTHTIMDISTITPEMLMRLIVSQQHQIRSLHQQMQQSKKSSQRRTFNLIENAIQLHRKNVVPVLTFSQWYKKIAITPSNLMKTFEYDLIAGIQDIILHLPVDKDTVPIILVRSSKIEYIYIYSEIIEGSESITHNLGWRRMKNSEMDDYLISCLSRKLSNYYINWTQEKYPNGMTMEEETLDIEYSGRLRYRNYSDMKKSEVNKNIKRFIINRLSSQNICVHLAK